MQIFLSYPSEERAVAERIHLALAASGHDVFFDREDLPPGDEYDGAVRRAMEASALLVFLITPQALEPGRYTLTELRLAQERWPRPGGHVLPVMLRPTPIDGIPAWLRAVTLLEPKGNVAAEVAFEAGRLLSARNPVRRARKWVTSPIGISSLILVAALGASTWRFGPRIAASFDAARSARHGSGLDRAVRKRARFIAATAEGYAVITSTPPQIVRYDAQHQQLGEPIGLPGDPAVLRQTPGSLLIATRTPDAVTSVDTKVWIVVDTIPLIPERVAEATSRVSGDITSIEVSAGVLWIVTGERAGEPTLLRLRRTGDWVVATAIMTAPPGPGEFDARGLHLESIGNELWAVTAETSPASLYRIMNNIRVDEISGHDVPMISCAHDLATSANGNMLLLSCDNELLEIQAAGSDLTPIEATATLPSESAPDNRTWDIIAPDGRTVFVALNTETIQPRRPAHARIARVDDSGSTMLFEETGAVITSMAVTPRDLLVVLSLADGTRDARRIARQR